MPFFTRQEKFVVQFLFTVIALGFGVGLYRHYFLNKENDVSNRINQELASFKIDAKAGYIPGRNAEGLQDDKNEEKAITKSHDIININKANKEELLILPKIGPVTAERIINFRNDYGDFEVIEDLMKVKGIGSKTFQRLKHLITI